MKIRWLGHAAFLITSDETGLRVVTDPYTPTNTMLYAAPDEEADVVTISHEHGDHNNAAAVRGNPEVLHGLAVLGSDPTATRAVRGVDLKAVSCAHDASGGAQRGGNAVFGFTMDGVRFCHLGDLGHLLSDEQLALIGPVDVLLCPVGGLYTITSEQAREVVGQIRPRVVIPMHVHNERCTMPFEEVEAFLTGLSRVRRIDGDASFSAGQLPEPTEVVVLKPTK